MAAVRHMHIIVPSSATVIMNDRCKYLTGPKSGIKYEDEEKARDVLFYRCNAPHILVHGHADVRCGPFTPLPCSWQNPVTVSGVEKTTVFQGWEASLAENKQV